MVDFAVQQKTATIANAAVTSTETAGTEYTAPASNTAAFIRSIGNENNSTGSQASDLVPTDRTMVRIDNPGNIVTSIDFTKTDSANGPIEIEYEIIEYIGAVSGANEFIIRQTGTVSMGNGVSTVNGATITGIVDTDDIVIFITGCSAISSLRNESEEVSITAEYDSGNTQAKFTRGGTVNRAIEVSFAVVEFTGSNWTIHRVQHSYTSAATDETENIGSTLGSITKTFLHYQSRIDGAAQNSLDYGQRVHISSTTQLTFHRNGLGGGNAVGVAWVIENTQSDGTPMLVAQYTGSRAANTGGNPDKFSNTITAVNSLTTSSVMGEGSVATVGGDTHRAQLGFKLTGTAAVTTNRARDVEAISYRFEVVEWPTVAVAGGDLLLTNRSIANYQGIRQ